MKYEKNIVLLFVLIIIMLFSGCTDLFQDLSSNEITYENHPTKISYHVTYGYQVILNGIGTSTVTYREDFPDPQRSSITNRTTLNKLDAEIRFIGENEMIFWNETLQGDQDIFLGISTNVVSESTIISDLSGKNALLISEIMLNHPSLITRYCQNQGNNTKIFINPTNQQIQQIATIVKENGNTTNSLLLAKDLFIWLKTNTAYQYHVVDQHIQPCNETFTKKTGDCDDLSFLYISLCRAVSIPARFIRGFLITNQEHMLSIIPHVWVEIFVGNNMGNKGWIPVECAGTGNIDAEVHQNFGLEDAHHLRLYVDDGSNESMDRYTNHISIKYGKELIIDIEHRSKITDYEVLESKKLCITDNINRNYC